MVAIIHAAGYRAFYRDAVDGAHWPGETTAELVGTRALHSAESEGVVVFHTNSAVTASALPTILQELAQRDYEPVRLSEHPIPPAPRAPLHPDFDGLRISPGFIRASVAGRWQQLNVIELGASAVRLSSTETVARIGEVRAELVAGDAPLGL